jgi:hypothetical protein
VAGRAVLAIEARHGLLNNPGLLGGYLVFVCGATECGGVGPRNGGIAHCGSGHAVRPRHYRLSLLF